MFKTGEKRRAYMQTGLLLGCVKGEEIIVLFRARVAMSP